MQFKRTTEKYLDGLGATELNTVEIWANEGSVPTKENGKLWAIYIHGGAWRDPAIDAKTFEGAISHLAPLMRNSIAAFASINYRLSPYPGHSTDPSKPNDPARNVVHPRHLLDVSDALLYLDKHYEIAGRYILAGHSAGATMTFQLNDYYLQGRSLPKPACVIGISGIYHFEGFVEAHKDIPVYMEIMENAFPNHDVWEAASPAASKLSGSAIWAQSKAVIISHSEDDELVEQSQASTMLKCAREIAQAGRVHRLELTGKHDEVWENGALLAGLISKSLDLFDQRLI